MRSLLKNPWWLFRNHGFDASKLTAKLASLPLNCFNVCCKKRFWNRLLVVIFVVIGFFKKQSPSSREELHVPAHFHGWSLPKSKLIAQNIKIMMVSWWLFFSEQCFFFVFFFFFRLFNCSTFDDKLAIDLGMNFPWSVPQCSGSWTTKQAPVPTVCLWGPVILTKIAHQQRNSEDQSWFFLWPTLTLTFFFVCLNFLQQKLSKLLVGGVPLSQIISHMLYFRHSRQGWVRRRGNLWELGQFSPNPAKNIHGVTAPREFRVMVNSSYGPKKHKLRTVDVPKLPMVVHVCPWHPMVLHMSFAPPSQFPTSLKQCPLGPGQEGRVGVRMVLVGAKGPKGNSQMCQRSHLIFGSKKINWLFQVFSSARRMRTTPCQLQKKLMMKQLKVTKMTILAARNRLVNHPPQGVFPVGSCNLADQWGKGIMDYHPFPKMLQLIALEFTAMNVPLVSIGVFTCLYISPTGLSHGTFCPDMYRVIIHWKPPVQGIKTCVGNSLVQSFLGFYVQGATLGGYKSFVHNSDNLINIQFYCLGGWKNMKQPDVWSYKASSSLVWLAAPRKLNQETSSSSFSPPGRQQPKKTMLKRKKHKKQKNKETKKERNIHKVRKKQRKTSKHKKDKQTQEKQNGNSNRNIAIYPWPSFPPIERCSACFPGLGSSGDDDERIEKNQQKHSDGTCDPCRWAVVVLCCFCPKRKRNPMLVSEARFLRVVVQHESNRDWNQGWSALIYDFIIFHATSRNRCCMIILFTFRPLQWSIMFIAIQLFMVIQLFILHSSIPSAPKNVVFADRNFNYWNSKQSVGYPSERWPQILNGNGNRSLFLLSARMHTGSDVSWHPADRSRFYDSYGWDLEQWLKLFR